MEQCYLSSRHHKYSYISCAALLLLLQSHDPLIVCLTNKDRFISGLLNILQQAAMTSLQLDTNTQSLQFDDESLKIKCHAGIVYLHKASVYEISGLAEKVRAE